MPEHCADFQTWLSAYLDEELDTSRQAAVRAHLDGCAACRREFSALQQTTQAMQAWSVPVVDPRLSVVFAERLSAKQSRRPSWFALLAGSRLAWSLGVVLLALCVLGLGVYFARPRQPMQYASNAQHQLSGNTGKQTATSKSSVARQPRQVASTTINPTVKVTRIMGTGATPVAVPQIAVRPSPRTRHRQVLIASATRIHPTRESTPPIAQPPSPTDASSLAVDTIAETTADSDYIASAEGAVTVMPGAAVPGNDTAHATGSTTPASTVEESPERELVGYLTETE